MGQVKTLGNNIYVDAVLLLHYSGIWLVWTLWVDEKVSECGSLGCVEIFTSSSDPTSSFHWSRLYLQHKAFVLHKAPWPTRILEHFKISKRELARSCRANSQDCVNLLGIVSTVKLCEICSVIVCIYCPCLRSFVVFCISCCLVLMLISYPARWSFSFILGPLHWSSTLYISNIQRTQK